MGHYVQQQSEMSGRGLPSRCRLVSGCQQSWLHWAGSACRNTNTQTRHWLRVQGYVAPIGQFHFLLLFVQVSVCMEHLRVVHVPQQGISLRVEDEVSPLEATAAFLLLNVQEAAYTVQPIHVRHAYAITYH